MSRIFVSHSSRNNDKAIEVRDWLAKNGWDDVFLDLDPERGIAAGPALEGGAAEGRLALRSRSGARLEGVARVELVQVGGRRRPDHGQEGDRGACRDRQE